MSQIPVEWPVPFAPGAEGPAGRHALRKPAPTKSNSPKGQKTFVTSGEYKRTRALRTRHGFRT